MSNEAASPPELLRWRDLAPEPGVVAAIEHAGDRPPRDAAQGAKRRWSERFAHACAVAFANALRGAELKGKTIRPESLNSGTEPLTPLGSGTSKRIDVTVADPMLGLEIGVSLKGLNFRDGASNNFDKNLTGRLYELGDEVRLVHEHLSHAFMAGVFFLPIEAADDKSAAAASSFAHTVQKLRERTGRLDPALAAHAARCDAGFVALYVHGDSDRKFSPGAARFFDIGQAPPRRGRPLVSETYSLGEVAAEIVRRATFRESMTWGSPEAD